MSARRTEMFSDGVFAIAITLLVLEIKLPGDGDLGRQLLDLWPSYLAYAISFLLIGLVWANHQAMYLHIMRANRVLVFVNMLLLANVAFLPFPTAVLARALRSGDDIELAACLYGATLAIGGVFFNGVWQVAMRYGLLGGHLGDAEARVIARRFLIGPAGYATAAAVALVQAYVALVLYAGLILYFWLPGRAEALAPHDDG